MSKSPLNIGFLSTRFHGTDGVTLEAKKWAKVLEGEGHRAHWFAGKLDTDDDKSLLCPEAYFDHPQIQELQAKVFGSNLRDRATTDQIHELTRLLKAALYEFIEKYEIDLLIPQNILAIPMNIPLGLAVTELLSETRLPTIAHHHDFVWERARFIHTSVRDYLDMAFPPSYTTNFRHVVINTNGSADLARRRGVPATVVPNVFDFENPPPAPDGYADDFRAEMGIAEDETLILQPTRIVPRKGIEHAVELCRQLNKRGRKTCLLISHLAGDEGFDYCDMLVDKAKDAGVKMLLMGERIGEQRGTDAEGNKLYTLWDAYPHADFVTYPSLYEGFGNAFLETVYFRKPVLVNRYSVYDRDLRPHGFDVVEMDGMVTGPEVDAVEAYLDEPKRVTEATTKNYQICLEHYSHDTLRTKLTHLISDLIPAQGN